jgi:flavin reductase (DIM6/NTAB) family NADH-FMN oxidoreductase RutF
MVNFTKEDFAGWDRFYRGNFINSLSGFKSASLIGTISNDGLPNVAIFSNIVHIGANPALIGFVNRPLEAAPHTLTNIRINGQYTINHIHPGIIEAAHQTSAKYPLEENEFDATGLTTLYRPGTLAPYVAESKVQYAMELVEIVPITHNDTFFVIGAVQEVYLHDASIVEEDGYISLENAGTITSLGVDGYYLTEKIGRYKYAKPGIATRKIS